MAKDNTVTPFRGPGFTPTEAGGFSLEQVAALLDRVRAAPAVLTHEHVEALEAAIEADRDHETRRISLEVLTQSGADLIEGVAKDDELAEACAAVLARLAQYRKRLEELLGVMDQASVRMCVALSLRGDGEQLLAAAQAERT